MRRPLWTGLMLCLAFCCGSLAHAGEKSKSENEKIEALIAHVEGLKQAKFVRNGVEYDARIAGRFLRYIYGENKEKVRTAQDFIRVVATQSGAGIPYVVRFPDGRESKSRDYLTELLKKWEMPAE